MESRGGYEDFGGGEDRLNSSLQGRKADFQVPLLLCFPALSFFSLSICSCSILVVNDRLDNCLELKL